MKQKNIVNICMGSLTLTFLMMGCVDIVVSDLKSSNTMPHYNDKDSIIGSGNIKVEARSVGAFFEVAINGVGTLTIKQGETESLTIEADDNILPLLTSEVSAGRLVLGQKNNTGFRTKSQINYNLTVKDLSFVKGAGSANILAKDIKTRNLTVILSGVGTVEISGKVEHQHLKITGSGSYNALSMESKSAKAVIQGTGNALMNVSDSLDVSISGVGRVKYKGNPVLSQKISGIGSIRRY